MDLIDRVDELLASVYKPDGVGAVALITRNGKTCFRKAYGLADLELGVPVAEDMVFGIGSVTKVFTAAVVMMLADDGLLSYDDLLSRYLSDCPEHWAGLTLHHLLAHTSGIPDLFAVPGYVAQMRSDVTPVKLTDMVRSYPLRFAPGSDTLYSNSNYVLLGMVAEAVSGKSLQQLTEERLILPLGLAGTYHTLTNDALVDRRAKGYVVSPTGGFRNPPYVSWSQAYGAGTMHSTVDDLATFVDALLAGRLHNPESIAHMTTPATVGGRMSTCGYGNLFRFIEGYPPLIRISGSSNGYQAYGLFVPDRTAFATVFSNVTERGAASVYFPGPLVDQIARWISNDGI